MPRLDSLHHLIFNLPARPFSGWLESGFFSHKFYPLYGASGICQLMVFCFTRCVVQHLGLSKQYIGLRSVIEGSCLIVCVWPFQRRIWSFQITWWPFTRDLAYLYHPILSVISDLVSWLMYSSAFVWWRSCGIIVPWLLVKKRFRNSRRDCLTTTSDVPASLLPAFWFCDKEGIKGVTSLLSDGISCVVTFPFYYIEEEIIE